jgi:hypothetical protein
MGDAFGFYYHNINWEYLSENIMVELEENVMINASFLPNAVLSWND